VEVKDFSGMILPILLIENTHVGTVFTRGKEGNQLKRLNNMLLKPASTFGKLEVGKCKRR